MYYMFESEHHICIRLTRNTCVKKRESFVFVEIFFRFLGEKTSSLHGTI